MTTGLTIGETLSEVVGAGTDMVINGDGTVDISIPGRSSNTVENFQYNRKNIAK